jgi:hypothetical protein
VVSRKARPVRCLVEAKLAAGAQHPMQFGQRAGLVGNAAEHEARDGAVNLAVGQRQPVGRVGAHCDVHAGVPRGRFCGGSEVGPPARS